MRILVRALPKLRGNVSYLQDTTKQNGGCEMREPGGFFFPMAIADNVDRRI